MKKYLFIPVLFILLAAMSQSHAKGGPPRVQINTSMGDIVVELDPAAAPKTVDNFLAYVNAGFYDGTLFHRVIPGFMIQGGGFDAAMNQKPTRPPVSNEADNGLSNHSGTIAMARTQDPHSATSQFFINVKNNDFLDHRAKNGGEWGYCVFGKVISGMDVVRSIERVSTGSRAGMNDVPRTAVIIRKVSLISASTVPGPQNAPDQTRGPAKTSPEK